MIIVMKTTITMKPYNHEKYWIMDDLIPEFRAEEKPLNEVLNEYAEFTEEYAGISISNNAIRNKRAMYCDTADGAKQVGVVLTGKTEIDDKVQYVDLWVNVNKQQDYF